MPQQDENTCLNRAQCFKNVTDYYTEMIRVDMRKMVEEIVWEFSMAVGKSKQIIDEAIEKTQNCPKCQNKPNCTENKEEIISHT